MACLIKRPLRAIIVAKNIFLDHKITFIFDGDQTDYLRKFPVTRYVPK